ALGSGAARIRESALETAKSGALSAQSSETDRKPVGRRNHLLRVLEEEVGCFQLHGWLAGILPRLLPTGKCGRLRALLYRLLGMRIGAGTVIAGPLGLG